MREVSTSENKQIDADGVEEKQGPQGIGMAVAFDWGLVVQLLFLPILSLILGRTGPFSLPGLTPTLGALVLFGVSLPFVALLAIFGEGVRRGWRWTRTVQIVANVLLFLGGLFMLIDLWQSIQHGNYWPLVTTVILVIFSPLIVWRLSRKSTARWFATVSSAEARQRHGGAWPFYIALWAIVGGVLQCLTILLR